MFRVRFASLVGLLLMAAAVEVRADPLLTFVHVFNVTVPQGGYIPGPVVGHQSSAGVADWALYGANNFGGNRDHGVIYKLAPPAAGGTHWTETRLYVFPDSGETDAQINSPLLFDASGALYGAAGSDGGCSTVFRLAPPVTGYFWKKTTLLKVSCGAAYPLNYAPIKAESLAMDSAGALYVTTFGGPSSQILRLVPPLLGSGPWTSRVLHSFTSSEGIPTSYPVVIGASGEVYGTTGTAVGPGFGSVYRLSPPGAGGTAWTYQTLLGPAAPASPAHPAALMYDPSGIIYGTAFGDPYDSTISLGVVFSLRPPAAGQTAWAETDLFRFSGKNGAGPNSLVRFEPSGPIYGTTATRTVSRPQSGDPNARAFVGGAVFELDPPSGGGTSWTEATLALTNAREAGLNGPLVRDPGGALYTSQPFGNLKYNVQNGDDGTILRIVR